MKEINISFFNSYNTIGENMRIIDNLNYRISDNDFKLIISDNNINIVNFKSIDTISENNIKIKNNNKTIKINGNKINIIKLLDYEIVLKGLIKSVIFEDYNE